MAEYGFLPRDCDFSIRATDIHSDMRKWNSSTPGTPIYLGPTGMESALTRLPRYISRFFSRRPRNPIREGLENILASIEKANFGVCFSTDLGWVRVVASMLSADDHLLMAGDKYGGTYRTFRDYLSRRRMHTEFIDLVDVNTIHQQVKPNTKMLWIETPTNPLLTYVDIRAASEIAHQYNLLVFVDNTFLSPYFQKPLEFGADVVLYSLTEQCNSHSDFLMEAAITNNKKIHEKLRAIQMEISINPPPFDYYMVIRSLKMLNSRMDIHMKNSLQIAQFLQKHPLVEKVLHPALESHPSHQIAKKQTSGWGGTFAFYVKGGPEQSNALISHLKFFTTAEKLGGDGSLIKISSVTTPAYLPAEEKLRLGITDNLIRVRLGWQSADNLILDLGRAFELLEDGSCTTTSWPTWSLSEDFEKMALQ